MSIVLTGTEKLTLTAESGAQITGVLAYKDAKGGVVTEHSSVVDIAAAGTFDILGRPPSGATRTVTALFLSNPQNAGSNAITLTAAGATVFAGTLLARDELTFDGSIFTQTTKGGGGGGGGGGSSAFTEEVTIHVPDESTPALALYNDTWDNDPTDPVLEVYVQDNGDAFIQAHSSGRTLQIGQTAVGIKVTHGTGLGFFGADAVGQPATPTTLNELIVALQSLGLIA